jgi:MFS family permease
VITYGAITQIHGPILLFGAWILWGFFWALASGTTSAYAYELIPEAQRPKRAVEVMGTLRAVASAAALVSYLLAGFLFELSPELPFAMNGLFALLALILIATLLPDPSPMATAVRVKAKQSFRLLFSWRRSPIVARLLFLMALLMVYFWSPRIIMQPLFIELDLSAGFISLIFAGYSLAGIFAGALAASLKRILGQFSSMLLGLLLLWGGVVMVGIIPGVTAVLFFPLVAFGFYLAATLLEALLHRHLQDSVRATALSAASFLGGVVIIGSRPLLGILADVFGSVVAFRVWGMAGVFAVTVFIVVSRSLFKKTAQF